jgi:hypothetical protein
MGGLLETQQGKEVKIYTNSSTKGRLYLGVVQGKVGLYSS